MKYYTMSNIDEYLSLFKLKNYKLRSKKKIKYYNLVATFDIETTNAYLDLETNEIIEADKVVEMKENPISKFDNLRYEKIAWMYVWQISIDDNLFMGRTWDEFKLFIEKLRNKFNLSNKRYMIIYVRNLEFEFQFIKYFFTWDNAFATKPHQVVYARSCDGIEFKCSYFLAGCSLDTTGKNLIKYKASKQVGKLDYHKIRNSLTPLTDDEIDYCLYDVIVDSNFIRESMEMEKNNNILEIPLTKTGYVRRYVKKHVLNPDNKFEYQLIIKQFTMDIKKYSQLKRAFAGGFTHSSALNTNYVYSNVHSQDFTSSYPACLLLEKYPSSKGRRYKPKSYNDFLEKCKYYCCIFDISLYNVKQRPDVYENIISESKCFCLENPILNNGRVVECDKLSITLTEVDFESIRQFYTFSNVSIANMYIYKKDYLPKPLLECVLHFYKSKTILKDVVGKETEYQLAKGMLNSIYGMMVMDPIKPLITFNGKDFDVSYENLDEMVDKYNNKYDKFLAYEHGLYCTAYARRNLFTGIKELGPDYIYADTDSLKYLNYDKHQKYFENYNKLIIDKINKVCQKYNFEINDFMPYTKEGKQKIIGIWDYEGCYKHFKTLGAKRYMVETDRGYNLTVSGLNKKTAVPYLESVAKIENKTIFDIFNDELFVAGKYSGKLLHTYLDDYNEYDVTDYLGNKEHIIQLSALHLEPSSYTLSIPLIYKQFIDKIQHIYQKGDKE